MFSLSPCLAEDIHRWLFMYMQFIESCPKIILLSKQTTDQIHLVSCCTVGRNGEYLEGVGAGELVNVDETGSAGFRKEEQKKQDKSMGRE